MMPTLLAFIFRKKVHKKPPGVYYFLRLFRYTTAPVITAAAANRPINRPTGVLSPVFTGELPDMPPELEPGVSLPGVVLGAGVGVGVVEITVLVMVIVF